MLPMLSDSERVGTDLANCVASLMAISLSAMNDSVAGRGCPMTSRRRRALAFSKLSRTRNCGKIGRGAGEDFFRAACANARHGEMSPVNNTAGGTERANLVRSPGRVKEFWYF